MKVEGTSPTTINFDDAFDGGMLRSLYARFAMLQHKMSESSKNFALSKMKQIEESQTEQKRVAQMLQDLRKAQGESTTEKDGKAVGSAQLSFALYNDLKAKGMAVPPLSEAAAGVDNSYSNTIQRWTSMRDEAANTVPEGKITLYQDDIYRLNSVTGVQKIFPSGIPTAGSQITVAEMNQLIDGIKYTQANTTYSFTTKQLDMMVQSAQAYLDQIGTNTQQVMVEVQDAMGQYNSLTQGCKSAIDKGNELLGVTARVS